MLVRLLPSLNAWFVAIDCSSAAALLAIER
jgi:hypothetical protein